MNKNFYISLLAVLTFSTSYAQEWKPAGEKILTSWGQQLSVQNPHPEYPRPQLERKNNWQNLNGLWNYRIQDNSITDIPSQWDGQIVVPFAIESALSGVGKTVGKDKALWYQNEISIPKAFRKDRLYSGAVGMTLEWEP